MVESPAFAVLRDRISRELLRAMNACHAADARREIHRAQGAITMAEAILRLPAVILEEMQAKAAAAKKR